MVSVFLLYLLQWFNGIHRDALESSRSSWVFSFLQVMRSCKQLMADNTHRWHNGEVTRKVSVEVVNRCGHLVEESTMDLEVRSCWVYRWYSFLSAIVLFSLEMNQIAWHMYVIVYLKVDDAIIYQWGSGHFDEDWSRSCSFLHRKHSHWHALL